MSRSTPIAVRLPMAFARGRVSMAQVLSRAICGDVRVPRAGSSNHSQAVAELRASGVIRRGRPRLAVGDGLQLIDVVASAHTPLGR